MNFKQYLEANYKDSDCPKGDFQKDSSRDAGFPWNKSACCQIEHLKARDACSDAIDTLRELQEEYNRF